MDRGIFFQFYDKQLHLVIACGNLLPVGCGLVFGDGEQEGDGSRQCAT